MSKPVFEIVGPDELPDECVEALASLLLHVVERENQVTPPIASVPAEPAPLALAV